MCVFKQCSYQVYGPDICAYMRMTPGHTIPNVIGGMSQTSPKFVPTWPPKHCFGNSSKKLNLGICPKVAEYRPKMSQMCHNQIPSVSQTHWIFGTFPTMFPSVPKTAFPKRVPTMFPNQFGKFAIMSHLSPKTIPKPMFWEHSHNATFMENFGNPKKCWKISQNVSQTGPKQVPNQIPNMSQNKLLQVAFPK